MHPPLLLLASLIATSFARLSPGPKQSRHGPSSAAKMESRRKWSPSLTKRAEVLTPKVFIISMVSVRLLDFRSFPLRLPAKSECSVTDRPSQFDPEADVWYENMPSILENNITVPGASPLFPDAHCTGTGEVCQYTTSEGGLSAS